MNYKRLADLVRQFENTELLASEIEGLVCEPEVDTIDELSEFLENELEYSNW